VYVPPLYRCLSGGGNFYNLTVVSDPFEWAQTYCASFAETASYAMIYGSDWILSYDGNEATFPPSALLAITKAWLNVSGEQVLMNASGCQ